MTVRNHRIRLMANSSLKLLSSDRVTYSSQLAAFPYSNSQLDLRSKVYKFSGRFTITSANKHIYIDDGAAKDVSIAEGEYTTPALLATQIQTALNAASSAWTCTYSTSTFKFTVAHTGSATLDLSLTTNALADTIGFTTIIALVGTSFTADQQRNHTSESIIWDLGASTNCPFFAMIGLASETFNISSSATTLKLYANSINDFSAPPLDVSLTRTDKGIFNFMDDLASTSFRWWKFEVVDKLNTIGPNLSISHISLGNYVDFDERDVGHGYSKSQVDPSVVASSEGGQLYFDVKTKYGAFTDLRLDILKRADKDELEDLFATVGKTVPFYCSIDPLLYYTTAIDELTKFVYFNSEPSFSHTFRDMFSTSLNLREAV